MKQINYAGTSKILTSDAVADAVIRYAAALQQSSLSDVVAVPTSDEYGQSAEVQVLLAPAIAVAIEPACDDALETGDDAAVHELEVRTQSALAFTSPPLPARSDAWREGPLRRGMMNAVRLIRTGRR